MDAAISISWYTTGSTQCMYAAINILGYSIGSTNRMPVGLKDAESSSTNQQEAVGNPSRFLGLQRKPSDFCELIKNRNF